MLRNIFLAPILLVIWVSGADVHAQDFLSFHQDRFIWPEMLYESDSAGQLGQPFNFVTLLTYTGVDLHYLRDAAQPPRDAVGFVRLSANYYDGRTIPPDANKAATTIGSVAATFMRALERQPAELSTLAMRGGLCFNSPKFAAISEVIFGLQFEESRTPDSSGNYDTMALLEMGFGETLQFPNGFYMGTELILNPDSLRHLSLKRGLPNGIGLEVDARAGYPFLLGGSERSQLWVSYRLLAADKVVAGSSGFQILLSRRFLLSHSMELDLGVNELYRQSALHLVYRPSYTLASGVPRWTNEYALMLTVPLYSKVF